MNPVALVKFFLLLRSFTRGASELNREDEDLIAKLPTEYHKLIRSTGRRIIWLACLGVFISLVVLPVAAPMVLYFTEGIKFKDALFRGGLLLSLAPMTFFLGIYWGLSIGMLTAPSFYLNTDLGLRWRQMCGANSLFACRMISLTVVVVGVAIYVWLFWLTGRMAPFA